MSYTIVDSLIISPSLAHQWLIRVAEQFYIVSAVTIPYSGPEVYVFPADRHGKITDFDEIVGIRGTLDHKVAIAELMEVLSEDEEQSNIISEYDALQRFDDYLNDAYPLIDVCGYPQSPARALKEVDEVAYREEFNNWLDAEGLELE